MSSDEVDIYPSGENDPHATERPDLQVFLISRIIAARLLWELEGYQANREFIDSVSKDAENYISKLDEAQFSAFQTKLIGDFDRDLHYQIVERLTNNTLLRALENVIANWRDNPKEIRKFQDNYIYKTLKGIAENPDPYPAIQQLAGEIYSVLNEVKNIKNPDDQQQLDLQLDSMQVKLQTLSALSIKTSQLGEAMERKSIPGQTPSIFKMLDECLDKFQQTSEIANTKEWVSKIHSFLKYDMREQAAGNRRLEINIERLEKKAVELLKQLLNNKTHAEQIIKSGSKPRWR